MQSPPPSGASDLQFVLTHEIGHALGLDHSSVRNAIMFPSFSTRKAPNVDDMIAISSLYDQWVQLTGAATDIGVGANNMAWAVGIDPIGDGYGIWKYNETTRNWDRADGFATRISVAPTGVPWAVQASGSIFRRRSNQAGTVGWDQIPGCARDIGIGGDGSVWVIGCEIVAGGYAIFKFNSLLSPPWERANGGAVRIAVSKTGIAWAVDSNGFIFQRNGTFAGNAGWTHREGCARDIAIHEDNYVWVAGCEAAPGGTQIYLYNQQFALNSTTEGTAPAANRWLKMDRGAVSIAVGPFARPWITRDNLVIWRSER